jgi:hypothetical protein
MHENQPGPLTPRSVDELESDTAWTVTRHLPGGRWSTAARSA